MIKGYLESLFKLKLEDNYQNSLQWILNIPD